MLKRLKIPLTGLTKKAHYVQALLDSGWVQGMDDDDDDVLPDDENDLVVPTCTATPARAATAAPEDEPEEGDDEDELVPDEDELEEGDEPDLEDQAFATLPAFAESYTDLIPNGWSVHEQYDTPSLADRVLVYCWENWSSGVVTTVYDRKSRRPACALSTRRATACVHWPSEKDEQGEYPHSYFHLTKNNYYVAGATLQEPTWLILKQDEGSVASS